MATYALTIAGVSKELLHQTLSISESNNGRNVASFDVLSLDGSYSPAMGAEVVLTEDGTRIFGGHVETPTLAGFGGVGLTGIVTKVSAVDFNALPDRRFVFVTIPPGTLKAALQVLAPYLTPYGVTLDALQVVGPSLPELIYDYKRLDAILNELSALSGGYVWEVDYNKTLRMFLPGSTAAPFNVVTGDGNALGDITVEPTRTDYANRIIVRFNTAAIAGYAFLNTTVNFANAETVVIGSATYTFDTVLVATAGHVLIGGNESASLYNLMNAITGSTGSGTLYAAATAANTQVVAVEQSSTQLRVTAIAPGTSGNSIGVSETALNASWITEGGGPTSTLAFGADKTLSNTATANNTAEQTANGLIERVYALDDVYAFDVAQKYADAYLVRAVAAPKRVSYLTDRTGIKPGMTQTITASTRGLSGTFTITDIRTSNPTGNRLERRVTAIGGTTLQETWKDTIKAWSGGGSSSPSVSGVALLTSGVSGGVFIDPISASGGGVYNNATAVRWTTDPTYRTAIWRSDDPSGSVYKDWNFEHIVSSLTAEATTTLLTKAHGVSSTAWSSASMQPRSRSSETILELWAENDQSGSTSSWRRPFLHFWSSSGSPLSTKLILGVGDISRSSSLSSYTLDYGIDISGGGTSVTGALSVSGTSSVTGAASFVSTVESNSTVTALLGYYELARTTRVGFWSTRTFAAGNYTSNVGTWTVAASDVVTEAWTLVGKTLTYTAHIDNTDVSGGPAELRIAIPGGFTAARTMVTTCRVKNNGTFQFGSVYVVTGSTLIYVLSDAPGTAWAAASGTTMAQITMTFEVQ